MNSDDIFIFNNKFKDTVPTTVASLTTAKTKTVKAATAFVTTTGSP